MAKYLFFLQTDKLTDKQTDWQTDRQIDGQKRGGRESEWLVTRLHRATKKLRLQQSFLQSSDSLEREDGLTLETLRSRLALKQAPRY